MGIDIMTLLHMLLATAVLIAISWIIIMVMIEWRAPAAIFL